MFNAKLVCNNALELPREGGLPGPIPPRPASECLVSSPGCEGSLESRWSRGSPRRPRGGGGCPWTTAGGGGAGAHPGACEGPRGLCLPRQAGVSVRTGPVLCRVRCGHPPPPLRPSLHHPVAAGGVCRVVLAARHAPVCVRVGREGTGTRLQPGGTSRSVLKPWSQASCPERPGD